MKSDIEFGFFFISEDFISFNVRLSDVSKWIKFHQSSSTFDDFLEIISRVFKIIHLNLIAFFPRNLCKGPKNDGLRKHLNNKEQAKAS
jgi:hypothetical protein